jgi:alkylated DNA repair dioxygenase AlkB
MLPLFDGDMPSGFAYADDFLSVDEESSLLAHIAALTFSNVEMRGGIARRRTVHFGWKYGYYARRTTPGEPLPIFLLRYREHAARWADRDPEAFVEALVTEYPEGAPIGWHRDAPMFGDIIGVSLGTACRMKFRPYVSPDDLGGTGRPPRRATHELELAPRSIYLLSGTVRKDFEHSIPPVARRRYSITFRTLRTAQASAAADASTR